MATEILVAQGIEREQAEAIGRLIAEHVRRDWGGGYIYVPLGQAQKLSQRDAEILRQYDGTNREALCCKYRISRRRFYEILCFAMSRKQS